MKPDLQIGATAEVTATVTEDMCPAFDGEVVHRVYSTWSMAHHMELAARLVLAPHLDPDEEGIGAHLSIDHVAPAPVGHTVRVVAVATEVAPTTVVCDCTAYDGDRVVGRGRQVQRVLPRKKLKALFERAAR
jgi:predicted thioesterase